MIKVKDIKFNLISFIIKAVLVVLSIAVSLIILAIFEQNGLLFKGLNFRLDVLFNNANFRINEKELERIVVSLTPAFFATKPMVNVISVLATFISAGIVVITCIVVAFLIKKIISGLKNISVATPYATFVEPTVSSYDSINPLNLTLTI